MIVNVEDLQALRVGTGGTGRYWGALGIRKRHRGGDWEHWEGDWEHWEGDWEHWERVWRTCSMTTMS